MKPRQKKLLIFISIILAVVIFALSLGLSRNDITTVKNTTDIVHEIKESYDPVNDKTIISEYDYKFDENIAGIRITDINDDINLISKINYLPDSFAEAGVAMKNASIIDINNDNTVFAKRGTLQLIILGPDPFSKTFKEDIKKLDKFKSGDYWHLTIQIPNIFTASNIYLGNKCIARNGSIKDYDFIQNSVTDNTTTDKHNSSINSTIVEMDYYTQRIAMNPNIIPSDQIITIHYELNTNTIKPINNCPLIGLKNKVMNYDIINIRLELILTVISGIVISIFLFIILLKRQKFYIPLLLSSFGIFIYSLTYILLCNGTTIPINVLTLYRIGPIFTIFTIITSLILDFNKNKNLKYYLLTAISLFILIALIPIIMPFVSYEANNSLKLLMNIILLLLSIVTIVIMIYQISIKNKNLSPYIVGLLISLSIIIYVLDDSYIMIYIDPLYWIMLIATITTFAIFLKLFSTIEKQNVYLTSNLKTEIEIHTNELIKALDERNTILQFLTHDLKKPTAYYINTLHKLETQIKDENQLIMIKSLIKKSQEVNDSLNTVSEFAKLNFLKEKLSIININSYLNDIYDGTRLDCEAAGVYLTLEKIPHDILAFVKVDGLKSALLNIIFNALEHSECSEIHISTNKIENQIQIIISDNGHGINKDIDIFKPYVSELKGGTHGLGLYISKQAVESMNGKIEYTTSPAGTSFIITLMQYVE